MYRALRTHDPLHRNPDGSLVLTRYADVMTCYQNPAMSSDKKVAFKEKFGDGPLYTHHTTSLVFNDPPYHTEVRKLLAGAFTPRKLAEMEPLIEGIVERMLDELEDMGRFDLIAAFAMVLPTAFARLGADPAFGSGPLATLIQALFSILVYFGVVTLIVFGS